MPADKAPPHVVFLPLGAPEAGASLLELAVKPQGRRQIYFGRKAEAIPRRGSPPMRAPYLCPTRKFS